MTGLSLPKVQPYLHDFSGGHRNLAPKFSDGKQFKSSNVLRHKFGTRLDQLEREATFHAKALNRERKRLDVQKQISQYKVQERLPLKKRKMQVNVTLPSRNITKAFTSLDMKNCNEENHSNSQRKRVHFEDKYDVDEEEKSVISKTTNSLLLPVPRSVSDLGIHSNYVYGPPHDPYSAVREMRERRLYKDHKTAFIHLDFAPASLDRLEELSTPSYHGPLQALFAKKRSNKETVPIRPRSICQLKNIETKAYEILMGRMKPKFTPVELENELVALQKEIEAEKKKKADKRKLVPQPVVLPSFEYLSKNLNDCRYLHTYNISFPQMENGYTTKFKS